MTKFGIQISKPGASVKSTNILDKILDNQYPFLKAFKQGTVSINVTAAGTYSVDVSHGLGYYPVCIYYVAADPNNPTLKSFGNFAASGVGGEIGSECYMTKALARFFWKDSFASGWTGSYPYKVTFYYYIFHDKIE